MMARRSVLLVGPVVATCGLALQVPIALVAEALSGKKARTAWWTRSLSVLGAIAVLGGFFGLNLLEEASGEGPPD